MEFEDVRTFVAVADTGSVSRAARELFVTQPAVTRRLRRLEASLATALFDRRRRPLVLTAGGRAALERGRRVLSSVLELRASTVTDGVPFGEFRIGVAHALTEVALTEPVDRVRQAFPKVALRLRTGWSRNLLERVRGGALDAAVILLPAGEALPAGVGGERVGDERLVVVASRDGRLPRVRGVADLADVTWILNPEGCGARALLQRALQGANLEMSVAIETYNYELQLCLVARNRGLGLVPARILARSRFRDRLRTLRVRGLDFPLSTWTVRGQLTAGLDRVLPELNDELVRRLAGSRRRVL